MFSTAVSASYSDVFIEQNHTAGYIGLVAIVCGLIWLLLAYFAHDPDGHIYIFASIVMFGGSMAVLADGFQSEKIKTEIMTNMISNVHEKYDAVLKLPNRQNVQELHDPQYYTLVFKDGAADSYKIYFEESGEPVMVDVTKAPSVAELEEAGKK